MEKKVGKKYQGCEEVTLAEEDWTRKEIKRLLKGRGQSAEVRGKSKWEG